MTSSITCRTREQAASLLALWCMRDQTCAALQVERELAVLEAEATHSHSHSHDEHSHSHDHAHEATASHDHDAQHSHGASGADAHAHSHGEAAHSHDADAAQANGSAADCAPGCTDPTHDHSHDHGHSHVHHKPIHNDAVSSVSFVIDGSMDLERLNMWMGALLEMRGDDIYRMKGILNIEGNAERFVFQVCALCVRLDSSGADPTACLVASNGTGHQLTQRNCLYASDLVTTALIELLMLYASAHSR